MLASGRPEDPQSWNRYAYAGNNPLRYVDPSGLDYYDSNGNRIGDSGNDQNYIVTDKDQINQIKKSKTVVAVGDVSSAILLPNGQVIGAMGNAVQRSNGKTSDDTEGGFHEEGGQFGLDSGGSQIAVAAAPGAYANPQTSNATVKTGVPADPADAGRIVTVQGTFHVHPKGEIVVGPGPGVIGGTTTTSNFNQMPSTCSGCDLDNARGNPGYTSFVTGARTNRLYMYNGTGVLTPNGIPVKNFLKIGSR